jgi:hypothetical protein
MAPSEITRAGILQAIAEHDRIGAEAFRDAYGYRAAATYLLEHEGSLYDSKAIAGVAHRYDFGTALKPSELSGGLKHAVAWLKREGFTVVEPPSPFTGEWETSGRPDVRRCPPCTVPFFCSGPSARLWAEHPACRHGRLLVMLSHHCW